MTKKNKEKKMWLDETAYFGTGKYTTSDYQAWMTIRFVPKKKRIIITIWNNMKNDIPRIEIKKYKNRKNIYKKYLYHLGVALRGFWKFEKFV